jgi:hypothetical protein
MPYHVENCRRAPANRLRLVENGDGIEAGYDLIAQLVKPVAVSGLDDADLFKARMLIDPIARPAVVRDIVKDVPAQSVLPGFEGGRVRKRREPWNPSIEK